MDYSRNHRDNTNNKTKIRYRNYLNEENKRDLVTLPPTKF